MVYKAKFNKTNLGCFMDGLDYEEPTNQFEEGWHEAIKSIRKHMTMEMA